MIFFLLSLLPGGVALILLATSGTRGGDLYGSLTWITLLFLAGAILAGIGAAIAAFRVQDQVLWVRGLAAVAAFIVAGGAYLCASFGGCMLIGRTMG